MLVAPTASIGTPLFDELADESGQQHPAVFGAVHTPYWNGMGNPVLAIPIGPGDDGLPRSLQIVGPLGGDDLVLRVGARFQQRTGWHEREPMDRTAVA